MTKRSKPKYPGQGKRSSKGWEIIPDALPGDTGCPRTNRAIVFCMANPQVPERYIAAKFGIKQSDLEKALAPYKEKAAQLRKVIESELRGNAKKSEDVSGA